MSEANSCAERNSQELGRQFKKEGSIFMLGKSGNNSD